MAEELCPNCGAAFTGTKCEYCGTPHPVRQHTPIPSENFAIAHPQFFETSYNFSTRKSSYRLAFTTPVNDNKWCLLGCTLLHDSLKQEIKFPDFLRTHTADGVTYPTIDLETFKSICHASTLEDVCVTASLNHLSDEQRARLHSLYRGIHEAIYGTGEYPDDLQRLLTERQIAESAQCADYLSIIDTLCSERDRKMKLYDYILIFLMTAAFICNEIMLFGSPSANVKSGFAWMAFVLLFIVAYLFKSASKSNYRTKLDEIISDVESLSYTDVYAKTKAINRANIDTYRSSGLIVTSLFIIYTAIVAFSLVS